MENTARKEPVHGYQFDMARGEFVRLDAAEPTDREYGRLVRVPTPMVAVAASVLSVFYVLFLPFSGIMAFLAFLGVRSKRLVLAITEYFESEPPE